MENQKQKSKALKYRTYAPPPKGATIVCEWAGIVGDFIYCHANAIVGGHNRQYQCIISAQGRVIWQVLCDDGRMRIAGDKAKRNGTPEPLQTPIVEDSDVPGQLLLGYSL